MAAGVHCSAGDAEIVWKTHQPGQPSNKARKSESTASAPVAKRARRAAPLEDGSPTALSPELIAITPAEEATVSTSPAEEGSPTSQEVDTPWTSSSAAVNFMEEPETLAAAENERTSTSGSAQKLLRTYMCDGAQKRAQSLRQPSAAELELLSLLPRREAATILVDNYFDRIHWFMLVFHQSDFREGFHQLYSALGRQPTEISARLGFLSVFAAVCVVSIRYTNAHQKAVLASCGVQSEALQQRLLTTLRLRLLDVVSLGSIEAVQTCILLGSFYLYHGEPELAWPICGCGLRIAQALNLHRRVPSHDSCSPDLDDPVQRTVETRKRCWWAVYEMETFCSMLYGFPLSITDDDCDIELLDPYAVRSSDPAWDSAAWRTNGEATLLSYKYSMAQLSIIVKSALTDLYGLRQSRPEKISPAVGKGSRLQKLIATVASLEDGLQRWYKSLPKQLRSKDSINPEPSQCTGAPENSLRDHLFRLQALALNLAFENARILVHRPLLSYKMVASSNSPAVALSIMTSLEPLSPESYESKMGIRRLMEMQSRLKTKSIVAEQGLEVLKKLMSLVLAKEMEKMFEFQDKNDEAGQEPEPVQRAYELRT
ncbi:hypothetical protein SLS56_008005 [Neofusicoccum ribis]|uniref:Xylanolytic transcriptional activator regulatory domain-containing protein n=1 Tax=Neofusicoccum ribis TaxID=45134 RepID=A0ABR3SMC3_9PEZI